MPKVIIVTDKTDNNKQVFSTIPVAMEETPHDSEFDKFENPLNEVRLSIRKTGKFEGVRYVFERRPIIQGKMGK